MSNRGETVRKTFSRKLGEVIDQRNRPELGNQLSTLNFRDQGDHRIVEARYINGAQTKALNNMTDQLSQLPRSSWGWQS